MRKSVRIGSFPNSIYSILSSNKYIKSFPFAFFFELKDSLNLQLIEINYKSELLQCHKLVLNLLDWKKVKVKLLCCVQLFATPWAVAYQAPQSMEFSRQEYWSGLPFPSPRDIPNPGIKPGSPTLQADALPSEPPGKQLLDWNICVYMHLYIHIPWRCTWR